MDMLNMGVVEVYIDLFMNSCSESFSGICSFAIDVTISLASIQAIYF